MFERIVRLHIDRQDLPGRVLEQRPGSGGEILKPRAYVQLEPIAMGDSVPIEE